MRIAPRWLNRPVTDTPHRSGGSAPSGRIALTARLRSPRTAVSAAFLLQGATLAMLLTLLPQFRDEYGLSEGVIVGVVVLVSVIAGAGSVAAEHLAVRTDSRITLRTGLTVIVAAVLAVGLAPGVAVFFAAFAVYGVGLGMVDASTNMQGVALQHRAGRSIMSSFYACWSGGAILGALWVAALSGLDAGVHTTVLAGIGVVAACALALSPRLLHAPAVADASPQPPEPVPLWPFLALGAAMALFFAIDFAVGNWSALFMTDVVLSDSGTAALALAAYQAASLVCRLTGDLWVRRYGEIRVVRAGAAIAVAGLVLVVAAQSVPMAIAGFLVVGLGAPVVAPLCFAAAGRLAPGGRADALIARLNIFNYAGTIVGGGIVGGVAALSDLRVAFAIPLMFAGLLAALAPAFRPRRGGPPEARRTAARGTGARPGGAT